MIPILLLHIFISVYWSKRQKEDTGIER